MAPEAHPPSGTVTGEDGRDRCPWGLSAPDYVAYHDHEWGRPIRDDDGLFERMSLEAFQSGLSWITILRKRPAFRAAFAGFAIEKVATFGEPDIARLLTDAGIVRNRQKIEAAITNARAATDLPDGIAARLWPSPPDPPPPRPRAATAAPAVTPESKAMAKELKRRGF